jgi:DNA phosphorothioation-dependent restriction protein DptF
VSAIIRPEIALYPSPDHCYAEWLAEEAKLMAVVSSLTEAYEQTRNLQFGNSGTIVGALETTEFMDALYVSEETDDRIDAVAESFFGVDSTNGELLIITGSAGDGKSAILARAFEAAMKSGQDWLDESYVNMDATAATRPDQSQLDSLNDFFSNARDSLQQDGEPRKAIAINLGIALSFFEKSGYNQAGEFKQIWSVLKEARRPETLDSSGIHERDGITVINLSYRPLYSSNPATLGAGLLRHIVGRFDYSNRKSPFYGVEGLPADPVEAIDDTTLPYFVHNLVAIAHPEVREQYVRLLAGMSLTRSEYINPRRILHFVASAIVPDALQGLIDEHGVQFKPVDTAETLTQPQDLLFWNAAYAPLQTGSPSGKLDPCANQSELVDERVLSYTGGVSGKDTSIGLPGLNQMSPLNRARTTIRAQHLLNETEFQTLLDSSVFERFASTVTSLDDRSNDSDNRALAKKTVQALTNVKTALRAWSGHLEEGDWIKIDDGRPSNEFQFFAEWKDDDPNEERSVELTTKETRPGTFWFAFQNDVEIPFNFRLYQLLESIANGYNPNAIDLEGSEGVRLIRSQVSQFTNKQERIEVRTSTGMPLFQIQDGSFGSQISINFSLDT